MEFPTLRLALSYHGQAVDDGRLDVYEAAANMVAFSEFVSSAARAVYGSSATMRAEVAGYRTGSFITDVAFQVVLPVASVLGSVDMHTVLKTIKEALELWKHLRGAPPAAINPVGGDGDQISVTNNTGDVFIVNRPTVTVVFDGSTSETVHRFVNKALAREGIDAVKILAGEESLVEVKEQDAPFFTNVTPITPIYESQVDYAVTIDMAAFKDGNKWRFSDGGASFYAEITDQDFLARVDAGEAFAKGDALYVRMHFQQVRQGAELATVRTILKVHEHIRKGQAGSLFS